MADSEKIKDLAVEILTHPTAQGYVVECANGILTAVGYRVVNYHGAGHPIVEPIGPLVDAAAATAKETPPEV